MMVSTKGRYALVVLTDLAKHQEDGFVSLSEVAERQKLSLKYLEIVVAMATRSFGKYQCIHLPCRLYSKGKLRHDQWSERREEIA